MSSVLLAGLFYETEGGRTVLRAMPLLLGVLCVLAIAYRYYSAFLAAKVAVLDDSRLTPAHRFNDGQNYHPTNKWVLFGHHFAAISGAGPLIGPVLAIQYGYMPGLLWLVIGVCLAGAVQDMLVLAASVRRGGKSLAEIARTELGPWANLVVSAAILFIVVIALAGLGVVVVKALGGEEAVLPAGMRITLPESAELHKDAEHSTPSHHVYRFPGGCTIRYTPTEPPQTRPEAFAIQAPCEQTSRSGCREFGRTAGEGRAARAGQLLGRLHHRLHHPHRPVRRLVHVSPASGENCRGVADRRRADAGGHGRRQLDSRLAAGGLVLARQGTDGLRPVRLRLRRLGAAGLAAALPARLPVELPQDRHHRPAGRRRVLGQSEAAESGVQPGLRQRRPDLPGPSFPFVFICIMCGAISGFHALVSSGTTPKMIDKESHVRPIGYGAMLMEGLVGVVALIAAASLDPKLYYDINVDRSTRRQQLAAAARSSCTRDAAATWTAIEHLNLAQVEEKVGGESLRGRTGGAVTLAVGMAHIFTQAAVESLVCHSTR